MLPDARKIISRVCVAAATLLVLAVSHPNEAQASAAHIAIAPASQAVITENTLTVTITQNATVPTTGIQTHVSFDQLHLRIVDVSRASPYSTASLLMGVAPQTHSEAIAEANHTGTLRNLAAAYSNGQTVTVGPTDALLITMKACLPGYSAISLADYEMIDETGNPVSELTATGGSVVVALGGAAQPCEELPPLPPAPAEPASGAQCPASVAIKGASAMGLLSESLKSAFDGNGRTASLHPGNADWEGDSQGISQLQAGGANVAQVARELSPSEQQGVYAFRVAKFNNGLSDVLFLTRDKAGAPRIDDTPTVYADDWINLALSQSGQSHIASNGFIPSGAATYPPVPDWDINLDGNTSLGDLGATTAKWGRESNCPGWIRSDGNNSGNVSLGDIGIVTGKWGNPGFIPPGYTYHAVTGTPFAGWWDRFGTAHPSNCQSGEQPPNCGHHRVECEPPGSTTYDTKPSCNQDWGFGDWSIDYYENNAPVKFWIASAPNGVSARVWAKYPTCHGAAGAAIAGWTVFVDIYVSGNWQGWESFSHLDNVQVSPGQSIGQGTVLGYTKNWDYLLGCWEVSNAAGVHVHHEEFNTTSFACWWSYTSGAYLSANQNFGKIGGTSSGPRTAC